MKYPQSRIEDATDTLAGVSFQNPYRWLEEDTDEVRRWQREQAALASGHVREWPHFDRLRHLVARFNTERRVSLPRYAGGQWFRTEVAKDASQAHAIASDEPAGPGRVLFDPRTENADRPPFLSWLAPSPDGRVLALGVCVDGSESNSIRLVDVASGRLLADPPSQTLMDNRSGGVQWLPDSSGFFFTAIAGAATNFAQQVYLHKRSPTPCTTLLDIPWVGQRECRMVLVSRDRRHAVALERMNNVIPVALAVLGGGRLTWRPFITSVLGVVAGHVVGDRYIAVTDVHAPRGRLVAIPLDSPDPNDTSTWQELAGESEAVLRTLTPVGDVLYLTEFVDTYSRIRIVGLDGQARGEVRLPGAGAVSDMSYPFGNLLPKGHPDQFLFSFSSLTESWGLYRHVPQNNDTELLRAPTQRLANVKVEDHCAIAKDGTRIPYHLVRPAQLSTSGGPEPTLIYAYGGFNVPLLPQFPGVMAAFIAAGGVFVHAHLRGGGEFGRDWWNSGRYESKQNCYDDLYAVAAHLIAAGRCSPETLALTGESNGGLMAGVALAQRPDLWAVVLPHVPRLDLIGACHTPYGRNSTLEDRSTDPDDPTEARRLTTFSPYHLVREGVRYPAVFVDAGDTDPRCPPQDARKFIARLQKASAGDAPILLHVWENAGHGWATDKTTAIDQATEALAFAMRHLGMRL